MATTISNNKDLIAKIGNYQLDADQHSTLKQILNDNPAAAKRLMMGCAEKDKTPTEARRKFAEALFMILNDNNNLSHINNASDLNPEQYAISMEKLLGKEVLALYHAAIQEEKNDPNFREAVFARALKHYDVEPPPQKLILWVAGPSASGKTYAAGEALKAACQHLNSATAEKGKKGHNAVFIDGGIEREESQMRQLVLQTALAKGYPGIKDLHAHTKLGIKKHVESTALRIGNVSLVIPNTFSNPFTKFKIKKYANLSNTKQIFSQIVGKEKNIFRSTVARMGIMRAYKSNFGKSHDSADAIKINNHNIGVESKVYQRQYFDAGVTGSNAAKESYLKSGKDTLYLEIINDKLNIYFDKTINKWKQCANDENYNKSDMRMVTIDDFIKWNDKMLNTAQNMSDFDSWIDVKNKNSTAPPNIAVYKSGELVQGNNRIDDKNAYHALQQIDRQLSFERAKGELNNLLGRFLVCAANHGKKLIGTSVLVDSINKKFLGHKDTISSKDMTDLYKEVKRIKEKVEVLEKIEIKQARKSVCQDDKPKAPRPS